MRVSVPRTFDARGMGEWREIHIPAISGLLSLDKAGATGLSFVLVALLLDLMRRSVSTYFEPDVGRFLRFSSAFKSLTVRKGKYMPCSIRYPIGSQNYL